MHYNPVVWLAQYLDQLAPTHVHVHYTHQKYAVSDISFLAGQSPPLNLLCHHCFLTTWSFLLFVLLLLLTSWLNQTWDWPHHGLDFLKHCEVVLEWGLFKYNMLKSYNGFVCPRWRETGFLPQFQMVTKLTSQSVNHARSVPNTQWYQPFVSTDCNTQVPFQKVTKSALGTKLGWREYRDWVSPESIFKFSSF